MGLYKVIGTRPVCGVATGGTVELLECDATDALVKGRHIKKVEAKKPAKGKASDGDTGTD